MSTELTLYFEQYAQNALDQLMSDLVGKSFYERILTRLQKKEDLSAELPIIKKVGIKDATAVAKAALDDYKKDSESVWELPLKLKETSKSKISQVKLHQEHLPRFDVLHQFATDAGAVKVHIITTGQNMKVEINAGKNKMAAQAAIYELEKQVAFANLTQS